MRNSIHIMSIFITVLLGSTNLLAQLHHVSNVGTNGQAAPTRQAPNAAQTAGTGYNTCRSAAECSAMAATTINVNAPAPDPIALENGPAITSLIPLNGVSQDQIELENGPALTSLIPMVPDQDSSDLSKHTAGVVPPGAPGTSSGSGVVTTDPGVNICSAAVKKATSACTTGQSIMGGANLATNMLSAFRSSPNTGDAASACDAMGGSLKTQIALNSAFAGTCLIEIMSCTRSCKAPTNADPITLQAYEVGRTKCQSFSSNYGSAGQQVAASALAMKQVAQCKAAAAAQDCTKAINANKPECLSVTANSIAPPTLSGNGIKSGLASQELPTVPLSANAAASPQNGSGGAPAGASNGAGYTNGLGNGGGSGAAGAGKDGEAKNPEVFMGSGNASSAGMDQFGSNSYDPTLLRANGDTSMAGFNLGKYLPKKAGLRLPASMDPNALLKNGITAANGLSNWEKITRKMREKQPELRK